MVSKYLNKEKREIEREERSRGEMGRDQSVELTYRHNLINKFAHEYLNYFHSFLCYQTRESKRKRIRGKERFSYHFLKQFSVTLPIYTTAKRGERVRRERRNGEEAKVILQTNSCII